MPLSLLEGPLRKAATADHPIHDLLASRWSPRAFDPSPLPPGHLEQMFEAARWSMSASNEQPWAFVYARREDAARWEPLATCLLPLNQSWARQAPVLLLAAARLQLAGKDEPNRLAHYDLGQSMALLTVQATALGLAVHQMAGFDRAAARDAARVPAGWEPVAMAVIGWPAAPDGLDERLRQREAAPRVRKPQAEFVFEGAM